MRFVVLAALTCALSASASVARGNAGHLKVLTYNVAGLPDGFSTEHPSVKMAPIGAHLAGYDLALLQEDFAYGSLLRQTVTLRYQSPPFVRGERWNFGDGLSQFSVLPFTPLEREPWRACHGIVDSYMDCLTPKGFSFSRETLASGVQVDVYNVHLDAGGGVADAAAREAQVLQLIAAISQHSKGNAILLAGDTNIRRQQQDLLDRLQRETGLIDVCSSLHCAEPHRIDRIFVRSSVALKWLPRKWSIDPQFVDAQGAPLSDHLAVSAELDWASSAR